jgi:hypothetical protein
MTIFGYWQEGKIKAHCAWYAVPSALYKLHLIDKLDFASAKLIWLLYWIASQHLVTVIELSDDEAAVMAGMERRSLIRARRQLVDTKLVTRSKTNSGIAVYTLLNPETGEPLPNPRPDRPNIRRYDPDWKIKFPVTSCDTKPEDKPVTSCNTACHKNSYSLSHEVTPHVAEVIESEPLSPSADNLNKPLIRRSKGFEVREVSWDEIGALSSPRVISEKRPVKKSTVNSRG